MSDRLIQICTLIALLSFSGIQANTLVVTGELSGDRLAAWYLSKHYSPSGTTFAITGPHLNKINSVSTIGSYTDLSMGFVGAWQACKHMWQLWRKRNELVTFAQENAITHALLVDCPLMNLALARRLKNLGIKVTYLAPPELWLWGCWGIDWWLKRYCDQVIVLYPEEQAWYKRHGLTTRYHGWPLYQQFVSFATPRKKEPVIAVLPGSRKSEVTTMLPLFKTAVLKLIDKYPRLHFIWLIPQSLSTDEVQAQLQHPSMSILTDPIAAREKLAQCCCALSKPGTITLELALLHVPTVVAFKLARTTYWLSKLLFQQPWVSLPNILLQKEVFTELLQDDCTIKKIVYYLDELITSWQLTTTYQSTLADCTRLHDYLKS